MLFPENRAAPTEFCGQKTSSSSLHAPHKKHNKTDVHLHADIEAIVTSLKQFYGIIRDDGGHEEVTDHRYDIYVKNWINKLTLMIEEGCNARMPPSPSLIKEGGGEKQSDIPVKWKKKNFPEGVFKGRAMNLLDEKTKDTILRYPWQGW